MCAANGAKSNSITSVAFVMYTSFLNCFSSSKCWFPVQTLLYEETVKAVTALLPNYVQGNLASLCTWPDDVRWQYKYRWSKELHYVDTPDFLCRYDYNRKLLQDTHNMTSFSWWINTRGVSRQLGGVRVEFIKLLSYESDRLSIGMHYKLSNSCFVVTMDEWFVQGIATVPKASGMCVLQGPLIISRDSCKLTPRITFKLRVQSDDHLP